MYSEQDIREESRIRQEIQHGTLSPENTKHEKMSIETKLAFRSVYNELDIIKNEFARHKDEFLKPMAESIKQVALVVQHLGQIDTSMQELKEDLKGLQNQFVTQDQLALLRAKIDFIANIVLTAAGAILLSVLGALIASVVK